MFKELFHLKGEEEPREEKPERGEPEGEIEWYEGNKGHLKKGVRPIMACVEAREQLERTDAAELEEFLRSIDAPPDSKIVDYYGNPRELRKQNSVETDL